MWEKLRVVFTIQELRRKILFTLFLLAIYRIGWQITLPMIDQAEMARFFESASGAVGGALSKVAIFSASNLSQATIFGLGIMPYISASIIFQLLGSVWGPLERLQKEGESGRKKINEYTRYATVVLCLIQSWFFVSFLASQQEGGMIAADFLANPKDPTQGMYFWWHLVAVLTMTAGTVFLMWLGEQIDEFGIGNGISLLIMAGILARMPSAFIDLIKGSTLSIGGDGTGKLGVEVLIVLAVVFVAVIVGVVFITQGTRRIPTQSAKHVRGRRVYGGTRQHLPLRVNQAGVMPIIFASSLLMFPSVAFGWLAQKLAWPSIVFLQGVFSSPASFVYNLLYVAMIYFFCYFWTAITFNPKDMAENLKNFGSFIPGYRPGKRTADYLEKVMIRITYVGAAFLSAVAICPVIIGEVLGVPSTVSSFFGGTGLLIAVSVAFDLVQKIDSHLVMRNYRGLLE